MKFKIRHFRACPEELVLIEKFLEWQLQNGELVLDPSVLKDTKGRYDYAIELNDEIIATTFVSFVVWFRDNGYLLA